VNFVLDASVALAWFLDMDSEATDYAAGVRRLILNSRAVCVVPGNWHLEVGSGLIRAHRNHRLGFTAAKLADALEVIDDIPVWTHHLGMESRHVVDLAKAYNLTGYDAQYFHLALTEGLPIASLDKGIQSSCKVFGVELLKP